MLSLLLGPDDFSKMRYVEEETQKNKAELVLFSAPESLPVEIFSGVDLFGGRKCTG